MLSRTGAAGARSLPAPAAPNRQRNPGPLERVLEGLPLPPNKATQFTRHCLTARRRAAPRLSERSGTTMPPRQNARGDAAAQPDEFRVGHCAAATKGSSELTRAQAPTHHPTLSRTVPLTVKLSGRAQALDWSRGRILSSSARGDTTDFHGPLQ